MARIDTTQSTILERILARLRDQLDLDDRRCYETLDAQDAPRIPVSGDYWVCVSPGDGVFEEGEQADPNVTENGSVDVVLYTRLYLDSTDHDEQILRDAGRGLLAIKKLVLKALVGYDLAEADGDTLLRDLLFCQTAGRPRRAVHNGQENIAMLPMTFGTVFDWELT